MQDSMIKMISYVFYKTSGKKLKSYEGHNGDVAGMSLKPTESDVFVTSSVDRTIRLWDLRTDHCQQARCIERI